MASGGASATDEAEVVVPARGRASHRAPVAAGERVAYLVSVAGDGLDVLLSASFTSVDGVETCLASPVRTGNSEGSLCPACAGTLTLTLDNGHSLLTRKTVRVSVARGEDNSDVLARDHTLANRRVMVGMELFFTNRFDEAEAFFDVHRAKVPVYNLCWATVSFFRAVMTWEPYVIAAAQERIRGSQALSETWLPREGVLASLRGLVGGGGGSGAPGAGAGAAGVGRTASPSAPAADTPPAGGGGGGGPPSHQQRPLQPTLSERQLEGTLVHSEATMLTALLCLMDESLLALVKTGLAIRSGWRHYHAGDRALGGCASAHVTDAPQLQVLLSDLPRAAALFPRAAGAAAVDCLLPPPPPPPPPVPATAAAAAASVDANDACPVVVVAAHGHVLGGFEFGLGAFNCLASVLPPLVLRVIAVLGFPCDRRAGLAQLRASLLRGGVTAPLAALFILCMRVLLPSFHSGDVTEHVPEAEAVLALLLPRYPDSALFLWLGGRLARMQGDVARAHALLSRAHHLPTAWPQLVHLCQYELGWNDAFRLHWRHAAERFALLARENAWSKMFYTYMCGLAALQQGDLAGGRGAMVAVLRLWRADATRKLGNRVISADQYALRRAAEFVAATALVTAAAEGGRGGGGGGGGGGDDEPDSEADVAAILLASGGYAGPRVLLPRAVARGSVAHAAVLAVPLPLPGLECVYLFNGASQMDAPALASAVRQVDAVVGAIARGRVFDATLPLWRGRVGATCCTPESRGGGPEATPRAGDTDDSPAGAWEDCDPEGAGDDGSGERGDAAAPSSLGTGHDARSSVGGGPLRVSGLDSPVKGPAAVTALLDAAAGAVGAWGGTAVLPTAVPPVAPGRGANGGSSGGEGGEADETTSSPRSPATTPMSRGGGSARGTTAAFGIGGILSGLRSTVGSVAGGALSTVGLGGASPAGAPALPPYARPTALAPLHTVAVAALVRGSLCAALGDIDAAAACFQWVVEHAPPAAARRELHAYAYAHYELGVLFTDGAKVKAAAAAVPAAVPAAVASPDDAATPVPVPAVPAATGSSGRHSRKLEGLASCALLAPLSVAQCVSAARRHLAAARDVRADFNWRLRLHLRVHLSSDDLRSVVAATAALQRGGGSAAWGATSWDAHAVRVAPGATAGGAAAAEDEAEDDEAAAGCDEQGDDDSELSEAAVSLAEGRERL